MAHEETRIKGMVYASLFGAATAVGAYIIIPIPPVPITLQTLMLSISAALLGGRLGALSQIIYLAIGAIGLPVFAGGKGGLGVLLGPAGGYLIGFVAGAYVIGKLVKVRKSPGLPWIIFAMGVGTLVIYLFGVTQLAWVARLSPSKAIAVGVLPFLIGDALKITAAAMVVRKIRGKISL
ncbi:MAG: biotin transporter BioY [Deltaproteobacteria bacterium]|nr:biotin transporter BioY [Deltaproteobacteria bacterium]